MLSSRFLKLSLALGAATRIGVSTASSDSNQPQPRLYTREEVKKSSRLLTVYQNGVYDLTSFAESHPGGDEIHRCYRGSLDKYFTLFPHHKKQDVLDILEELRVGELAQKDPPTEDFDFDPERYRVQFMIQRNDNNSNSNSNSKNEHLVEDTAESFSINELKIKFPHRELMLGVACGMHGWKGRWAEELVAHGGSKMHKGVWLGDVLTHFGLDVNSKELMESYFVHYHCYDDYVDTVPLTCLRDVKTSLLVFERNGKQLTTDKPKPGGGPLMALTVGTHDEYPCDAKWLTKIVVNRQPSSSRHGGKYD